MNQSFLTWFNLTVRGAVSLDWASATRASYLVGPRHNHKILCDRKLSNMPDGASPLTISRVANVLQRAGYDATVEWEADFLVVRTRPVNYHITVYLYTEDEILPHPMLEDEPCVSLQLSSNWIAETDIPKVILGCNKFNSANRFAKGYVLIDEDYRRLSLDLDIFAEDGISDRSIIGVYERFIEISSKFDPQQ